MAKGRIRVRAPRGYIGRFRGKYRAEVTIDGQRARRVFGTEEDLDLATGRLLIRRRIIRSRTGKGYDVSSPKTERGYRVVKLPGPVLEMVAGWRERQEIERRFYRLWREGGWLFTGRQHRQPGKHLDPTSVNWLLDAYLKKAGIAHVTVHGLRHSFCTWLLNRGVPARDVQQVVGHSKVSATLDMYWEAVQGAEERVAEEIGRIVSHTADEAPADFPQISHSKRPSGRRLRLVSG